MVTAVLLKDSLARVSRYGSDAIIAFIPSIMEFSSGGIRGIRFEPQQVMFQVFTRCRNARVS